MQSQTLPNQAAKTSYHVLYCAVRSCSHRAMLLLFDWCLVCVVYLVVSDCFPQSKVWAVG